MIARLFKRQETDVPFDSRPAPRSRELMRSEVYMGIALKIKINEYLKGVSLYGILPYKPIRNNNQIETLYSLVR